MVGGRLSGVGPALVAVVLTLAWLGYEHIFNPYPDVYFMPFIMGGILSALAYDHTEKRRWLLVGGLLAGGVFLFKHNVGVFVFGCGVAALAIREATVGEYASRRELALRVLKSTVISLASFGSVVLVLAAYRD